jgi:hypothetical protein
MGDCSADILLFTIAVIVVSLASADTPKIKLQACEPNFLKGKADSANHVIVHISAIEGMRMGDDDAFILITFEQSSFNFKAV